MGSIGKIREFRTKNFIVVVDAIKETDLDLSWDETGETASKIDSGEYVAFCARARVLFNGQELASDYLGNCVYESFAAFEDHRECAKQNRDYASRGIQGRCGSYFADMVSTVIAAAREKLRKIQSIYVRGK